MRPLRVSDFYAQQSTWFLGAGVYFGQLLGMADHLSFTLGRAGYRIHKIVPYGPVHETLQYLIRSDTTDTLMTVCFHVS